MRAARGAVRPEIGECDASGAFMLEASTVETQQRTGPIPVAAVVSGSAPTTLRMEVKGHFVDALLAPTLNLFPICSITEEPG